MKHRLVYLAALAALLGLGGTALASHTQSPIGLSAVLGPLQEVPHQTVVVATASGKFIGTVQPARNGYRLSWQLTTKRLSGPATSAYIHEGKPGYHGAAFVHLCSPCSDQAHGTSFFSPTELQLAREGRLYVNVRTAKNPAGEIRGQISVP
jgi:CHRD domain-containing protein